MSSGGSVTGPDARCCGSSSSSRCGRCTTTSQSFTARCEIESKCAKGDALESYAAEEGRQRQRYWAPHVERERKAESGSKSNDFLGFILYFLLFLFLIFYFSTAAQSLC